GVSSNRGLKPLPDSDETGVAGNDHPQQPLQALARMPSTPSFAMMGTMMRAAIGSAHQRPNKAFRRRPPKRMADRYTQKSVCLASACMAALPRALATLRLARESSGIATSDTQARMIPGMLCSGD